MNRDVDLSALRTLQENVHHVGSIEHLLTRIAVAVERLADRSYPDSGTHSDPLLETVLIFTGTLYEFDVGALLDSAAVDEPLRQALGDLDAWGIGRALADRENQVVLGRRLVKLRRGGTGNRWRFEVA